MRKAKPKKRILLPDPKFHDVEVTRFVNNLMLQGKKSIAYSIFYDAIDMVGEKMKDSDKAPLDIWKKAVAMKNMISFARKRSGHSMAEKLCAEIVAAFNNEGGAFKRKEDMHRMAEANKAFAHFRF